MKAASLALAWACLLLLVLSVPVNAGEAYSDGDNADLRSLAHVTPVMPTALSSTNSSNLAYAIALSQVAYQLICDGEFHDAEGRLRQALLFEPTLICANCNLGFLLYKTGRARESLPFLQYAYSKAPFEPAVVQCLAATYQVNGNLATAMFLYQDYLRKFPAASDARFIAALTRKLSSEATTGSGGHGGANLNWNKRHVRVFVQQAIGVPGFNLSFNEILKESFRRWADAGVISFEFVDSPKEADIECLWTDKACNLSAAGEGGETILKHIGDKVSHARITMLTQAQGAASRLSAQEVRALCLHEIGHALGLVRHSRCPNDVMFCTAASSLEPSPRDFISLKNLYQRGI
jgi:tetratricopeptide (TPR) repeat protein